MTEHSTLDPARVYSHDTEPLGGPAPHAAPLDSVWADHDLLDVEFDAIIAANFPGVAAAVRPARPRPGLGTATGPPPAQQAPNTTPRSPGCDHTAPPPEWRARQRSPPAALIATT